MQVIRKSDFNHARYIIGEVVAIRGDHVQVQWRDSTSKLQRSSLIELDDVKLADLNERIKQRRAKERAQWIADRPFVCVNVNREARVDNDGHRKGPINLLPSQVKDGKCYYCGSPVVARCQRCENPVSGNSAYCEQCQKDLADQNQEEK